MENTRDHRVLGKRSCNNVERSVRRVVESGREAKGDRDGGLGGGATVYGLRAWEETEGGSEE